MFTAKGDIIMAIKSETETVVKKILPYLERRGYDIVNDLEFEKGISVEEVTSKVFIDILVTLGKKNASFLIEAKKLSKKLTNKDRDQAIKYAKSKEVDVPFVVVTNGVEIQCFNTQTKQRIKWDGKVLDKIPSKEQLPNVIRKLRSNPYENDISISNDNSLPYRQGLPLRKLNALFAKGHSTIRKIEKDEENAFADFSKLLFLRLLEEKADVEKDFPELPYSYRFYELANYPIKSADQVKTAINSMIGDIVGKTPYGEVLEEPIKIKNPKTYLSLVKDLSSVSFYDCSYDSKGAAFEYYVRATLKGKKLGQYFTPRPLIRVMGALVGENKIINSVIGNTEIKILDPACGTGGFLVFLMQENLKKLQEKLKAREITNDTYENAVKKIKGEVFFGSDANAGVAAAAKMNMIIAGDGHSNIKHEDSLAKSATNWNTSNPDCTLIFTNPPFGTSEGESQSDDDKEQYDVKTTKGQYLFLQKMVNATKPGGEICTVIDEGVLNTDSGKELRKFILQNCYIRAVVSLPSETFKPNKINVKCSLLYLEKRKVVDIDLEDNYPIAICKLLSLGYSGSGDIIRGFEFEKLLKEVGNSLLNHSSKGIREGYMWRAFDVDSVAIASDITHRFDYKYWDIEVLSKLEEMIKAHRPTIDKLNQLETCRKSSPSATNYVDEKDGYAVVVKAGSSISKLGDFILEGSDWIEKSLYDEYCENEKLYYELCKKQIEEEFTALIQQQTSERKREQLQSEMRKCIENIRLKTNILRKNDVILASTGDGTLGKACVYNQSIPAIADGHVTIIRVDSSVINPYYLADYLRKGFGNKQIERLYTGSTGLIELTPEQVASIVVDTRESIDAQKQMSKELRNCEKKYAKKLEEAEKLLKQSEVLML